MAKSNEIDQAIPVGSSHRATWFVVLVATSVGLLIVGGLTYPVRPELAILILIGGGVLGLAACLAGAAISAAKATVRIALDGFILHDRHGERQIADEQVICASLYSTSNYANGELKSTTRTFDVWIDGESGAERLKMVNRVDVGTADPLEPLIERILHHLHQAGEAMLADGQPFEGEGWTLHATELVASRKRDTEAVRIDELEAVDVFDDSLCVWKHGQDETALRIPLRSANAHVLLRLLSVRVAPPTESDAAPSRGQLGRILFERSPSRTIVLALWLLPIASGGILLGFCIAGWIRQQSELMLMGGLIGLVLGLVWLIPLTQCVHLRCHERGLVRRWLRWEKRLAYADVESFTYGAVRQYFKGVYSGTTFTLTFVFDAGGKAGKLTYSKTLRNADNELDHLRDHVSRVIAARMADQFASGRAVVWTEGLRFLPEGLEYRASGLLGRKSPVVLPYDQITGIDVDDEFFRLWVATGKKPVAKETVAQPNFFPGYMHLTRLLMARRTADFVSAG